MSYNRRDFDIVIILDSGLAFRVAIAPDASSVGMDGPLKQQVQIPWHVSFRFLGNTFQIKSSLIVLKVLLVY